ncbi:MAG: glycerate kinase [Burkholderiaceae bacterium]
MNQDAGAGAAHLYFLEQLYRAAVEAVRPEACMPAFLPAPPKGRTVVVGAGKAAASMARVVERHWRGPLSGLVVTRHGHSLPCERIEVVEAGHPVPDSQGLDGARRMLEAVSGLTADDLVLCLISGGGSSLLTLPAPGLTLADKQKISRALLHSGADITEMNTVRKHLSAIKGGRLAIAAAPAPVLTLVLSDVTGDDPSVVGSGPTVADPSRCGDALAVLEKYRIDAPEPVRRLLLQGKTETPKPGDPGLKHAAVRLIASGRTALDAAARLASQHGYDVLCLGDAITGESREVAKVHAGIARYAVAGGTPLRRPGVLLSGGETTVTVTGKGRGGRNAEFLLALAIELDGAPGVYALAADTDGIDGTEDNAGCLLAPQALSAGRAAGIDARLALASNDGYGFFEAIGALLVTGPTLTNVNDFRAILLAPD